MADVAHRHQWRFHRLGGFDQVRIERGADLRHLPTLDQKLWATLSCPTTGVEFDARTLALLDTNGDGRIRVPEVLAAVTWTCEVLKDPADLLRGDAALPLGAINPDTTAGREVLRAVGVILTNLARPEATVITAADTADTDRIISTARFNGDGVIPPTITEYPALAQAITDIMACVGSAPDRSGAEGLSRAGCERFFSEARDYLVWFAEAALDPDRLLPVGDDTASASEALAAVRAKLDDYFTRTRLAAFDAAAATALNPGEGIYAALAAQTLGADSSELAALPLARIEPERPLPLTAGVNPAWSAALERFRELVVTPLLGPREALTEAAWRDLQQRFAAHDEWHARMRGALARPLGQARLQHLLDGRVEAALLTLIEQDLAPADAVAAIGQVDRLVHYYQHLHTLLNNFVALRDFYDPTTRAIFQAGTLYLDGRACDLCIQVSNVEAHAASAPRSNCFLVYCDCVRRGGSETMHIAAAVTVGGSDQLRVGRNGLFYDRKGQDWDATVVKVVDQPIGVGEAFWRPYKRLARMVSEQLERFAGTREAAVDATGAKGLDQAGTVATATNATAKPPPSNFDIAKFAGIFAAIGLAIGAIGTAFAALLGGLLNLPWWQLPMVVLGVILVISGPSMLLAYLKLRARNLGPLLDANGWAINTAAKINLTFGSRLTQAAMLPVDAERAFSDPFAERRRPWGWIIVLVIVLAGLVWFGRDGQLARWWEHLTAHPDTLEQAADAPAAATEAGDEAGRTAAEAAQPDAGTTPGNPVAPGNGAATGNGNADDVP